MCLCLCCFMISIRKITLRRRNREYCAYLNLLLYYAHLWNSILHIHVNFQPHSYIYLLPVFFLISCINKRPSTRESHLEISYVSQNSELGLQFGGGGTFKRRSKYMHYLQGGEGTLMGRTGVVDKGWGGDGGTCDVNRTS